MSDEKLTPEQKKLVVQAQEMIDRRKARLVALATTLTTTDRIITGRRDIAVFFGSQRNGSFTGTHLKTPAYTDGGTIGINDMMLPDVRKKSGLVTMLGLNYHELAHILFTPGKGTGLVSAVINDRLWNTFNLLEDARIESFLVAKYRSAAKFLSAPVLEFIIKDEKTWATAHLLTHGRRFLPKEVRKELRDVFQGDHRVRHGCETTIDEYRKLDLSLEKNHDKALKLIQQLDTLINTLKGDLNPSEEKALNDHSGCGGIGNKNGSFTNSMLKIRKESNEASRRQEENDAAEESAKNAPDQEGDKDEEDSSGEQPERDSGDVRDDQEDDGDDIEDATDQDEDGDGGEDSEEYIDEDDEEDGLFGDEPEGDDDSDAGSDSGWSTEEGDSGLGDDGDASGDDSSSDAVGGENAAGVGGGAGSLDALADALADAIVELENDTEIEEEVSRLQDAMDDDSLQDSVLEEVKFADVPVDAEAAQSASLIIRELQKLNTRFEAGWEYGTDTGRLNTQRAMTAEWGDTDIWDHWDEGNEQDAALEVVFTMDRSGSMDTVNRKLIKPACTALWVLKRAIDEVDGFSTALTFDSGYPNKLYGRGERANPNMIRQVGAQGGTEPKKAVDEARRILNLSERPNKLYVMITDGSWGNDEKILSALESIPGTRIFIGIGTGCDAMYRKAFDVISVINSPKDIVEVTRKAVTSMLDEVSKRK